MAAYNEDLIPVDPVNLHAQSYYGKKNFDDDVTRLSKDNPYITYMAGANNKTDYKRLYTQAVQWEANLAKNAIDMANTRQLRDEDRAYNHPLADIARQRAAGLNPDLLGVGSGSGSGSGGVSAPGMDSTDLTDQSTPTETAGAVSSVMGSSASLISSVTGGIGMMTDVFQSIKNFENVLRMSSAQAGIAESQDQLIRDTLPIQKANQYLGLATQLASVFPFEKDEQGAAIAPTLAQVSGFAKKFGIDDSSFNDLLFEVVGNPKYKGLYDQMQHDANMNQAKVVSRSLDFYQRLNDRIRQVELIFADADFYRGQFESNLNRLLSASGIAEAQVSNTESALGVEAQDIQNAGQSAKLIRQQLARDIHAFDAQLRMVREQIIELEGLKKSYLGNYKFMQSPEGVQEVARLDQEINLLYGLGSSQLQQANEIFTGVYRRLYLYDSIGVTNRVPFTSNYRSESILPSDWTQEMRNSNNFSNFFFRDYVTDPDRWGQMANTLINGASQIGVSYATGRAGKTPRMKGSTETITNGKKVTTRNISYDYGE